MTRNAHGQEWANLDLSRPSEQDRNILEPYTFGTLLLEIHCNVRDITPNTIRLQFEEQLRAKMQCAREVFEANAESIYKQAQADRAQP
jgi:hypothetical protein